jgi:hypothetical protein
MVRKPADMSNTLPSTSGRRYRTSTEFPIVLSETPIEVRCDSNIRLLTLSIIRGEEITFPGHNIST